MKIVTWNVNGIRARHEQVRTFIEQHAPDVVCLQEIKALPAQVPATLLELPGYASYWHGGKGYSGVALLVRQEFWSEPVSFQHPAFDLETRIVVGKIGDVTVASVYVPNGGKDFDAKMQFLVQMEAYAAVYEKAGESLVLAGDLNIALTERDVHPKERRECIGQSPLERAQLAAIIDRGLVDVGRALDPENDGLFTWWAPWRKMRERNIGWRLDYLLASKALADKSESCAVYREFGTSDHGPVMAEFRR